MKVPEKWRNENASRPDATNKKPALSKKDRHKQRSNTLQCQEVPNFPFLICSYHCEMYLFIRAYVQKQQQQCIVLWGGVDFFFFFFLGILGFYIHV